jgi:signal transduction histidine kinase
VTTGSLRPDSHGVEYRLLMPDGVIKHISVAAHPTRAPGPTAEYVGAVRDVTELKQSESTLQRTREALADVTRVASLGEMSAAVAHEVNQPLAAIGMNASTCLRWLRDEQLNVPEAVREKFR